MTRMKPPPIFFANESMRHSMSTSSSVSRIITLVMWHLLTIFAKHRMDASTATDVVKFSKKKPANSNFCCQVPWTFGSIAQYDYLRSSCSLRNDCGQVIISDFMPIFVKIFGDFIKIQVTKLLVEIIVDSTCCRIHKALQYFQRILSLARCDVSFLCVYFTVESL